ncbi:oligopeptide ABC transporter permease OppC [Mesoplasma corruscae]|uniref:Oligopeptide ABC transporter permease n=1 Tax=Mesoplasma corruscae TaxID=216874 RepID=A0A2S5RHF4_9MOLU|nr:oligopeptide ABC transporter permease OppC [Mesoplasma corruscae]PPE06717.1 oligopeptide ABC transporter permease [Mesoplasma corruscae]
MENKFNYDINNLDDSLFVIVGDDVTIAEHISTKPYSYWKTVFSKSFRSPTFIICTFILLVFITMACSVAIGKPAVPRDFVPSLPEPPSLQHLFGTGKNGQDLWTSVWVGSRTTLWFAIVIFLIQAFIGILLGSIWGFYSKLDLLFIQVTNFITLIPQLVLFMMIIYILGQGAGVGILAVSITSWIGMASTIRFQIIIAKHTEYNISSVIVGSKGPKIIRKNIIPKILPIIIYQCSTAIPAAFSIDASLATLGIGIVKPGDNQNTSLGILMSSVMSGTDWQRYPHLLIIPLVFVGGLSLVFYLVGKVLADSLDPRTHR